MSLTELQNPALMVPFRLEERNRVSQNIIEEFKHKHGVMDVGVGLVGLIPGAAIPALIGAIALQSPVIYQPLARRLAQVYLAPPRDLDSAAVNIVFPGEIMDTVLSTGAEFGTEFIQQIAPEILADVGMGAAAATFIPFAGAVVAAGLDYYIASKMTGLVGKMVSIFFQNGINWRGTKRETYESAKRMSGTLDDIRRDMSDVGDVLLRNLAPSIAMMRSGNMSDEQIRSALRGQGVPRDLIDKALHPK